MVVQEDVSLYRQLLLKRQTLYEASIASGQFDYYIYPWDTLPALWLILAIILFARLPTNVVRIIKYPVAVFISLHCIWITLNCRTLNLAGGYGIGLANDWAIIMTWTLLVFNDVKSDFWRLEVRPTSKTNGNVNGTATEGISSSVASSKLESRERKGWGADGLHSSDLTLSPPSQVTTRQYKLVWQGHPDDMLHAIDWTMDLLTALRGVNWNFRVPILPPLDIPLPSNARNQESRQNKAGTASKVLPTTLRQVQIRALRDFVVFYLVLDFLKTTMITDPYFLGLTSLDSPTPWLWLAKVNYIFPLATIMIRLLMSISGVIAALTFIFSLGPLFFTVVLPSMVDVMKITRTPLLEPAMYAPFWLPLLPAVCQSGLGGVWGKFWHQMFRYGISDPSRFLIIKLRIDPYSTTARTIRVLVAFFLTGTIHGLASLTTISIPRKHPFTGAMAFFLANGAGTVLQAYLAKIIKNKSPIAFSPLVCHATNALFVLTFMFLSGPLLANDFAACGIWLFEPVPVSFLRGLGFGPGGNGEGWWCWEYGFGQYLRWIGPEQGERSWLRSGIAIY